MLSPKRRPGFAESTYRCAGLAPPPTRSRCRPRRHSPRWSRRESNPHLRVANAAFSHCHYDPGACGWNRTSIPAVSKRCSSIELRSLLLWSHGDSNPDYKTASLVSSHWTMAPLCAPVVLPHVLRCFRPARSLDPLGAHAYEVAVWTFPYTARSTRIELAHSGVTSRRSHQ